MTLLIVNDMEPTVQFLATKVDWPRYGIDELHTAYNAREARDLLEGERIDIILCDIQMPGENGIELIRWVCESGIHCECIFLTCYADFSYAQEAIHLGCSDYVLFPAPAEEIGEAVRKVVGQRHRQQENDRLRQFGQHWLDRLQEDRAEGLQCCQTPREIVDDTIRYVMDNLSSPELNVNTLARRSCLNLSYFSRLFKKTAGISISQLIIRERMELAARLLQNPQISVSAIALETGYSNYPYFTAMFKKFHGCTPSQYRERYMADHAASAGKR